MVGEQIGFDEGGVLEALRDPVFTKTVTKYRHNKEGLVTSETVTVVNITGAHIVAASLGPALIALFIGIKDILPDLPLDEAKAIRTALLKGSLPGLLAGIFSDAGVVNLDVPDVTSVIKEAGESFWDLFKHVTF